MNNIEKEFFANISVADPEDLNKHSGIEDDPYYGNKNTSYNFKIKEICTNPGHNPPMFISIPPGKIYRHVCPGCGANFILRPAQVTF